MKSIFKGAIRGAGGQARLAADETRRFTASIQPLGFEGDGHSTLGTGYFKSYKIFAEYNDTTQMLRENDAIVFDNRTYIVKSLSPSFLNDNPVYISGILTLCEEEDA